MFRYGFMIIAALVVLVVAAAASYGAFVRMQQAEPAPAPAVSAQAAERPNVLIILTDDHPVRNDFYSVMPETMRIFRDGGRHYENGVATTPICCPARASLFSGQYVHNHGVIGNIAPGRFNPSKTLQRELRAAGYFTAISGKFLNEWTADPPDFDRWAMMLGQSRYSNVDFNVDGRVVNQPGYTTTVIRDHALGFLDDFEATEDSKPWFLEIAPLAPHGPATPEAQFSSAPVPGWKDNPATTETDVSDKPAYVRDQAVTKSSVQVFRTRQARTLKSVDVLVARVFEKLSALGEAENTLAFFMGDHGHMLWEHRLKGKKYPYNQTIRAPYFVRWPGHMTPGSVSSDTVANIDVAPTIYAAAGVTPSYVVDGKPLGSPPRAHILVEYLANDKTQPNYRGLWTPRWEYLRYRNNRQFPSIETTTPREYYGPNDPWQLNNVYGDGVPGNEPANQAELDALVEEASTCTGAACP